MNMDPNCVTHAQNGWCHNPTRKSYMDRYCDLSCSIVKMESRCSGACTDTNDLCEVWAAAGDCHDDSRSMVLRECRGSCKTYGCQTHGGAPEPAREHVPCVDFRTDCKARLDEWSGFCDNEYANNKHYCGATCGGEECGFATIIASTTAGPGTGTTPEASTTTNESVSTTSELSTTAPEVIETTTSTTTTSTTTEFDDGFDEDFCKNEGAVAFYMKGGRGKIQRRGGNSFTLRVNVPKVDEQSDYTGLFVWGKKNCGGDFIEKLASGEISVDVQDQGNQYTLISKYHGQEKQHENVVFQYTVSDSCDKCLGNGSKDQLEVVLIGTAAVDFGNKDIDACITSIRSGHTGDLGSATQVAEDVSPCVSWVSKFW